MRFSFRLALFASLALPFSSLACDRNDSRTSTTEPRSPSVALVESALAKFRSGQKSPPKATDPRLERIVMRLRVDDIAGALAECDALLSKEPGNLHARYFKAFANHRTKLYAAARPDFETVLQAGPVFAKADGVFLYYAWCCFYLGDLETAAAAFDAVWELRVDPGDARYGLGLIAIENGELDRAEALLRESKKLFETAVSEKGARATDSDKKNVAKAKVRIGSVLLQRAEVEPATAKERLAEARTLVEDAVRVVSTVEEAWFTLSRIYARLGEKDLEQHALETMNQGRESLSSQKSESR